MIDHNTGEDTRGLTIYNVEQSVKPVALTILDKFVFGKMRASENEITLAGLPIEYILAGSREDLDGPSRMEMMSSYTAVKSKSFGDYLNRIVTVKGILICEHGEYEDADGHMQPSFRYALMKTDQEEETKVPSTDEHGKDIVVKFKRPVVIKVSANQPCQLIIGLGANYGWMDWESPMSFMLSGVQSEGYYMQMYRGNR